MNILNIIPASRRRGDPDAADYFARIVSAGSTISVNNQAAVNAFIVGCKADGIWTAIKAACFLAGPDDLTGALVPLVGTAPTNNGPFDSDDYDRTTGLVGNGITKYLDANRAENADPQDDFHLCTFVTVASTSPNGRYICGGASNRVFRGVSSDSDPRFRCRSTTVDTLTSAFNVGLVGFSRSSSENYTARAWGVQSTISRTSSAPTSGSINVFAELGTSLGNARQSFYSIGESIDLAALDARLATYMASIT
jgi:hypothetical protein